MRKALLGFAAIGVLAGCTSTLQDMEGVDASPPDAFRVWQSADQFPNLARTCIDGVAFLLTTRDYQQTTHIPEWDKFCPESDSK